MTQAGIQRPGRRRRWSVGEGIAAMTAVQMKFVFTRSAGTILHPATVGATRADRLGRDAR